MKNVTVRLSNSIDSFELYKQLWRYAQRRGDFTDATTITEVTFSLAEIKNTLKTQYIREIDLQKTINFLMEAHILALIGNQLCFTKNGISYYTARLRKCF